MVTSRRNFMFRWLCTKTKMFCANNSIQYSVKYINQSYITNQLNRLLLDFRSSIDCRGGVLEDVLGLEDTFWSPWPWPRRSSPWPRSLKSSKIALSSARGQHYFLNRWNFVGKCQKPRGKFANTFFVFLNWSISVAKGRGGGTREPAPPNWNSTNEKMCQKAYCFFSFNFF